MLQAATRTIGWHQEGRQQKREPGMARPPQVGGRRAEPARCGAADSDRAPNPTQPSIGCASHGGAAPPTSAPAKRPAPTGGRARSRSGPTAAVPRRSTADTGGCRSKGRPGPSPRWGRPLRSRCGRQLLDRRATAGGRRRNRRGLSQTPARNRRRAGDPPAASGPAQSSPVSRGDGRTAHSLCGCRSVADSDEARRDAGRAPGRGARSGPV